MILKLILLIAIIYFLYKALGGSFSLPKKEPKESADDGNELVECSKCGVYITKKEAKIKFGKYYCDECV